MLAAVTGWPVDADELRATARRIVNLRKAFNQREGWTRAEDTLPPALLSDQDDPTADDAPRLSTRRLDTMIDAYYALRGWDSEGRIDAERP